MQAEELSGVKIKGSGLATTLKVVNNRFGKQAHEQVRAALPEETRVLIDQTLVSEWYPIEHVGHVLEAIKSGLRDQGPNVIHEVSTGAAKAAFNLVYRVFFKFGSPNYIIKRTTAFWTTMCTAGKLDVIESGERRVVLRLTDFPYINADYCQQRLSGWMRAPLELSGCEALEIRHPSCTARGDSYCQWDITWT